jgi:hypothetical protein
MTKTDTDDESHEEAQENQQDEYDPNVLRDGAEIHFTDDRDPHGADRVEFLNGGWVRAVYKNTYQMEVYPPHVVEGVYTHTNAVEDGEWW